MNLKISSESFPNPALKPLLKQLIRYFDSINTPFYIIGATARDIIMSVYGEKSGRATYDLDIAIAIPDWSLYEKIENDLIKIDGFTKDNKQKQRFLYSGIFHLDIVPFGSIMNESDRIFWHPDKSIAMSVLGFSEVGNATQEVVVDNQFSIKVASLAGVFLLKIVAWSDRHISGNKDADDIGFILTNYFGINEERLHKGHFDVFNTADFSIITAGATLLGRDLREILKDNPATMEKVRKIISDELNKQEESKLVGQILETNRLLKYNDIIISLSNIVFEMGIKE